MGNGLLRNLIIGAATFGGLHASAHAATAIAPNLLFDLSHFKLTLPVDANGGSTGAASTIQNAQLNATPGYSSKYFYLSVSGEMVFYAPTNGATTTPGNGSDHTRAELRELYMVKGPTEWTNKIGGTMSAECRVNSSSVDTDESVIGQIHGLSSIMVILDYNPRTKNIEAKLYPNPSSSKATVQVLVNNVAPGALISYSIQWIGSTLSITVNGRATNWTVSSAWDNVPVYFKAGAYSGAPSKGNPAGDATQVSFRRLHIQH